MSTEPKDLDEEEDDSDDELPESRLPDALLAAAGITSQEEWDALPPVKLRWPRSLGAPPDGIDVELVDG